MRMQFNIKIRGDEITTPGTSFGYGRGHIVILRDRLNYVLIKKRGATEWGGVAMPPSYYPTEYWLCRKRVKLQPNHYRVEILVAITPGRRWKKAMERMAQSFEAINTQNEEQVVQRLQQFNEENYGYR